MISLIRYAQPNDTRQIWEAHQASINAFCSKDYTAEQIKGWTSFSYSHEYWVKTMNKDVVLVLELNGSVEGFGHLSLGVGGDFSIAEVEGLYFAPEGKGLGLGRPMLEKLETIAREKGTKKIVLDSTHTSVGFYEKCGYEPASNNKIVHTRGVTIELVPMQKFI